MIPMESTVRFAPVFYIRASKMPETQGTILQSKPDAYWRKFEKQNGKRNLKR